MNHTKFSKQIIIICKTKTFHQIVLSFSRATATHDLGAFIQREMEQFSLSEVHFSSVVAVELEVYGHGWVT